MNARLTSWLIVLLLVVLAKPTAAQQNWPQFRGAQSLGVAADADLPDTWTATENVAWKTDIAGARLVEPRRLGRARSS